MPLTAPIPKNTDAENAVIGCLLYDASPYAAPLTEDHFAQPDCQLVFRAIRALADDGKPVTLHTVKSHLAAQGALDSAGGAPARFLEFTSGATGGDTLLRYYFDQLEAARRNRAVVLHINANIEDLAALRLDAMPFVQDLAAKAAPVSTAAEDDSVAAILQAKEERLARGEAPDVFATGLRPLDRHLDGGFHRGDLGIFAAYTGRGKSALLMQCAAHMANLGRKVRYFTLELSKEGVFDRMACALRGVSPKDGERFRSALRELSVLPIKIHGQFSALAEILAELRAAVRSNDCDVAVVDYVQRVNNRGDNREQEVAGIARGLKDLALRENIVVLSASQLNDNGQLRESKAIGMEADAVFTVTEDGLRVDKYRRGPDQILLPCHLHGPHSRFVETARGTR